MSDLPMSPVPADSRPWYAELPFTAFGQFGEGMMDLRVFDQDEFWVDRSGVAHRLEEMSATYRANVIDFLTASATVYYAATVRRAVLQALVDARLSAEPLPGLDPRWLVDLEPAQWLEMTPLMLRLRLLEG